MLRGTPIFILQIHCNCRNFEENFIFIAAMEPRCILCRGEATSSTAHCTCIKCTNCDIGTAAGHLCTVCRTRPQCPTCKRHLPASYFDGGLCGACLRRHKHLPTRRSTSDIVVEVDLPTTTQSESYQEYVTRNADLIHDTVQQHLQRHRYVAVHSAALL